MAVPIEQKGTPIPIRLGLQGIRRLTAPYSGTIWSIALIGLLAALADGLVPYVTGRFFDALIALSEGEVSTWAGLPLWSSLLGVWLVVRIFSDGLGWWIDRKRRWLGTNLQPETLRVGFAHLLRLPLSFHVNTHVHEQIEKINAAGWRLNTIVERAIEFFPQLLSIGIGIALAYSIKPELANVLLIGVVAYAVILVLLLRGTAEASAYAHKAWSQAWDDSVALVTQALGVKQATAETYEIERTRSLWKNKLVSIWYNATELVWSRINMWQRIIVLLTQLGIFLLSIQYVSTGAITVGELVALNGYALMFFGPLVSLGSSWQTMQNGMTSAGRMEEIMRLPEENYQPVNARTSGPQRGEVRFEDVTFRYEQSQEVLKHFSFMASPGQSVAFVGESGVGKSTAISLISAYYFPAEGKVLVDGVDTREWDLLALRSRMAVVPQEVALFNDTVRANIRYGSFNASDSAVERAAQEAHIHDFIMKQEKGYDTLVGERGIKLSVGQKQRVAIARAILRNPEFLILDEPTSALDIETEQLITTSLEKLMRGRTTFIIAHRLSTVRKADQILVIKDGMIAEQGSHAELIKKPDGVYKHLYELHVGLHE